MTHRRRGVPGKLSAIVMVKDEEEYVGYAILSLLALADEVLVVDGGSSDGTLPIVEAIAAQHDPDRKLRIWVDTRPKHQLIHVRTDMVRRCTGDWILRLEGDEVYDDRSARLAARLLKSGQLPNDLLSVGWPYWFFVGDLQTIVPVGEPHTFATIAVRNVEGLHADHHRKDASATFWDEGWFDAQGRNISIHWPGDNPTARVTAFGVHHYAFFKRTSRHHAYARTARRMPFAGAHPEVFARHDFRALMRDPVFVNPAATPAPTAPARSAQ